MLSEFLTYLTSPASRYARKHGYVGKAIALKARHRRCEAAWLQHLENCRAFIIQAMAQVVNRQTAVVLGSGHLLDIPLPKLEENFSTIYLCDIFHPKEIRALARERSKIHLLELDLTQEDWKESLPEADFLISSGVASQLPLLPMERLGKSAEWAGDIINQHFNYLCQASAVTCLISETERILCAKGEEILKEDPLFGQSLPATPLQEWDWLIAPKGEISREISLKLRVKACIIRKT